MSFFDHAFVIFFVFYTLSGVLSQIDISPKPTAVVNVGEDLTFNCTRTTSTWHSFTYNINKSNCFLTFAKSDPCQAAFISCIPLQSYSYSCDKVHFNLMIRNVQRSMQNTSVIGLLVVDGLNSIGTDIVTIQVNVPLRNVTLDPTGLLTLVEGETRQVTCSAVSIPPATLSWSLNGSPLENTLPNVVNDDTVTNTYSFKATKQDNGKTLTCTASYGSVSYKDNATLNIEYLPNVQVTPSEYNPYTVIENTTNLHMRCSVIDTNPGVTYYKWYKDGSTLPTTTADYTISTVGRSDGGGYSCDATNTVGTSPLSSVVRLDVLYGLTLYELGRQEVKSGSKLDVNCIGQSNPPITDDNVIWTKQNNNTFAQTGRHLIITNVSSTDTGIYICTVNITLKPSIGIPVLKSATVSLAIYVLYIPIVQVKPSAYSPYKIIENTTDLQLRCSVIDTNPEVTSYRWYKDGFIIPTTTANYVISTVRRSDAGNYKCDASNVIGTSNKPPAVKLEVLYGITLEDLIRKAVNSSLKLDVTCTGQSNPPITDDNVRWTKQNNNSFFLRGSKLTITNVNRADKGIFICTVDITLVPSIGPNVQISATVALEVDVLYGPSSVVVSPPTTSYTVTEGSDSIGPITCTADCRPKCAMTWSGPNLPNGTVSVLNIQNIIRIQSGDYHCTANNSFGSQTSGLLMVIVNYDPTILSIEGNTTYYEDDTAEFRCLVDSFPESLIQWLFIDGNKNTVISKDSNTFYKVIGSVLNVYSMSCLSIGQYSCEAANGIGTTQKSVNVTVMCSARLNTIENEILYRIVVRENESLNITVPILAYPTPWLFWQFQKNQHFMNITNGVTNRHYFNRHSSSLFIQNMEEENFGTYVIYGGNGIGNANQIGSFNVVDAQNRPSTADLSSSPSFPVGFGTGFGVAVIICIVIVVITALVRKKRKRKSRPATSNLYEETGLKSEPANIYNELNQNTKDGENELLTRRNKTDIPNMYDDIMAYDNQVINNEDQKGQTKGSTSTQIGGGIYMNTEI